MSIAEPKGFDQARQGPNASRKPAPYKSEFVPIYDEIPRYGSGPSPSNRPPRPVEPLETLLRVVVAHVVLAWAGVGYAVGHWASPFWGVLVVAVMGGAMAVALARLDRPGWIRVASRVRTWHTQYPYAESSTYSTSAWGAGMNAGGPYAEVRPTTQPGGQPVAAKQSRV